MQRFYISIFLAGTVMSMLADTSPLWLRSAAISPDGKTIAFTFRGDIYTVSSEGGKAFQLTSGDDFEKAPVWSPDGSKIAFSSNKAGTHDVYIIPSEGGNARRLTSHSGTEIPLFFMDDENVIFTASMMPDADDVSGFISEQIYTVPVSGGRARQYASLPVLSVSVDKNGRMLYQDKKGVEDPFRKHERSSGTSDIWIIENGQHRKLTDFNGHDMNPVWAGEDSFFYISEEDGTLNVWKSDMQGNRVQLTHFTQHPVRSLSA